MNNTDKLMELIKENQASKLASDLAKAKRESKQDALSFGCHMIALQTTNIVMAGLCGMSDDKDQERYQAQFLGAGDTLK